MLTSIIDFIRCVQTTNNNDEINAEFLKELRYAQLSSLYLTESFILQNKTYQNKFDFLFDCFLSKEQKKLKQKFNVVHTCNFVETTLEDFTKHLHECLKGISTKLRLNLKQNVFMNLNDIEKLFIVQIKYRDIYSHRVGIGHALNLEDEKNKRKRCIGAIKVMLCDLYTTYYRLCRYDRLLYMEGKRHDQCVFLQVHLAHFILSVQEKIILLDLTNEELQELEMMWTCNFTVLQFQNYIHCEKTEIQNVNIHLNVSKKIITNKNNFRDIYLCYLYTEWERLVCGVAIMKPEELDKVMSGFNKAKCWLKVNSKKVKEYQEKVRKLAKKETEDLCTETGVDLFAEQPIKKERCELLNKIKQHYNNLLTGDIANAESMKKIHQCMFYDIYNDLEDFIKTFTETTNNETVKCHPQEIKEELLPEEEYWKKLSNIYTTNRKSVPDRLKQKIEELTKADQTTTSVLPGISTDIPHFEIEEENKKQLKRTSGHLLNFSDFSQKTFKPKNKSKKRKTSAVEIIEGEQNKESVSEEVMVPVVNLVDLIEESVSVEVTTTESNFENSIEELTREEVNVLEIGPEFVDEEQACAAFDELDDVAYKILEDAAESLLNTTADASTLTYETDLFEEKFSDSLPGTQLDEETTRSFMNIPKTEETPDKKEEE